MIFETRGDGRPLLVQLAVKLQIIDAHDSSSCFVDWPAGTLSDTSGCEGMKVSDTQVANLPGRDLKENLAKEFVTYTRPLIFVRVPHKLPTSSSESIS